MTAVPAFKESSRELIVEVAQALEPYFPDITHNWREKLTREFGFDGRVLAAMEQGKKSEALLHIVRGFARGPRHIRTSWSLVRHLFSNCS